MKGFDCFFFFLFIFFFVLQLPDSFPVIFYFSLLLVSYVLSSTLKRKAWVIHTGDTERGKNFISLSSLIVTFLFKFNERSLTIGGGGGGPVLFQKRGPKTFSPSQVNSPKILPPPKICARKLCNPPRNNILCIHMLHRENPYERNFGTIFHWNKKSVSTHNIYKTQFLIFVTSITTQQFNNHRTVQ